ncbi:hypothetical protein CMK11_01650 [Candidatus Poribacteria bacterium]|nr:hypothetical protein [Candidatus Poribacteria bacterium]
MRNYAEFEDRLHAACASRGVSRTAGFVDGRPVFHVSIHPDAAGPPALLIAGTHGDEPAGVEAALQFIERASDAYPRVLFEALPCTNPHGYVHATRENAAGIDLNWVYDREDLPEIRALRDVVAGRRFRFVVDMHEDWESPGYYAYELRRGAPYIGGELSERVSCVCPINHDPVIEGDRAVAGVIHPEPYAERREHRGHGVPVALYEEYTDHLLTSESPTSLPLQTRVDAHLAALTAVIEAHVG